MSTAANPEQPSPGPKYFVNIEGTEHPWDRGTITPADIRTLGGLPANEPVIEIDLEDNSERQLAEGEPVELKPGRGFARKIRFKRG